MLAFFNGQYQEAKSLLYAGRYEEAAAAFRAALSVDPLNNSLHLYLAGALRQAGRPREAGRSYREALRIEPRSPRAWFGWGEALLADGRPDSAEWAFEHSTALLPGAQEGWLRLGSARWRAGRTEEAAAALERALSEGAASAWAHGALARLYAEDGPEAAPRARAHLEAYARLLGTSPEDARGRLPERPE
jgi:tetratricopeptide (TPR) repeat protein